MSEYSGKTNHLWGVLRPDGRAVTKNPTGRFTWDVDDSLSIAGFRGDDDYAKSCAKRAAEILTDNLIGLGVDPLNAAHTPTLFTIVTSVTASADAGDGVPA